MTVNEARVVYVPFRLTNGNYVFAPDLPNLLLRNQGQGLSPQTTPNIADPGNFHNVSLLSPTHPPPGSIADSIYENERSAPVEIPRRRPDHQHNVYHSMPRPPKVCPAQSSGTRPFQSSGLQIPNPRSVTGNLAVAGNNQTSPVSTRMAPLDDSGTGHSTALHGLTGNVLVGKGGALILYFDPSRRTWDPTR